MSVLLPHTAPRVLDEKEAENLASTVRGESRFLTSLSSNSRGRFFVNVTDPERKNAPFTLRDKVDWEDKRPRKRSRSGDRGNPVSES